MKKNRQSMSQREVWDSIAEPWRKFKQTPFNEVEEFLSGAKGPVLDVGCGSGRNFLREDIFGTDFSIRMLRLAREKNSKIAMADLVHQPFRDGAFETVLMVAVLHCYEGDKLDVLKEAYRVLKKAGKIFITVWNKNQPKFFVAKREAHIPWRHDGTKYNRYYYLFTEDELRKLLEIAGFEIEEIKGSKDKAFKFSRNIIAIARK